ncbi:hypothetical protein FP2506_18604 [Fulvimarina pelagi HTCC2506]|uniref:Uncharacterized protein n=1 Tax=Fulvimarina pelagi HTCC2506 TaxID=314231 RepID=Q0G0R2_9HYPH|nr:hypothetical protein FP2506_18604 [Fulvimarina pelagi HTCC2506]
MRRFAFAVEVFDVAVLRDSRDAAFIASKIA